MDFEEYNKLVRDIVSESDHGRVGLGPGSRADRMRDALIDGFGGAGRMRELAGLGESENRSDAETAIFFRDGAAAVACFNYALDLGLAEGEVTFDDTVEESKYGMGKYAVRFAPHVKRHKREVLEQIWKDMNARGQGVMLPSFMEWACGNPGVATISESDLTTRLELAKKARAEIDAQMKSWAGDPGAEMDVYALMNDPVNESISESVDLVEARIMLRGNSFPAPKLNKTLAKQVAKERGKHFLNEVFNTLHTKGASLAMKMLRDAAKGAWVNMNLGGKNFGMEIDMLKAVEPIFKKFSDADMVAFGRLIDAATGRSRMYKGTDSSFTDEAWKKLSEEADDDDFDVIFEADSPKIRAKMMDKGYKFMVVMPDGMDPLYVKSEKHAKKVVKDWSKEYDLNSMKIVGLKEEDLEEGLKIGPSEKKVINSFLDKKPMDGKKLSTDGKSLDIGGMGGRGAAVWEGGKIRFQDLGSKTGQTVERAVRKMAPKNWLGEEALDEANPYHGPDGTFSNGKKTIDGGSWSLGQNKHKLKGKSKLGSARKRKAQRPCGRNARKLGKDIKCSESLQLLRDKARGLID